MGEDAVSGGDCGGGLGEELSARGVGLGLGCRVCVCIGLTRAVWSGKIMKITNVQPSIYARKQLARLQRSSCWIGLGGKSDIPLAKTSVDNSEESARTRSTEDKFNGRK